jgi:RNA polymerase sigma factor for flagellar operon FliA
MVANVSSSMQLSSEQAVSEYKALVTRIAHHILHRVPPNLQLDDLIQVGMIGLLEATDNYSDKHGASFETYAGIRIRGAMLDEVRRQDWTPRSVHKKARMVSKAIQQIEHQTGRDARDSEVAALLNIDMQAYHKILRDSQETRLSSMDELLQTSERVGIGSNDENEPLDGLSKNGFQQALSNAIASLPERECLVIKAYYDEEVNLREIGVQLGVSESRICQIHSQAVLRLQARMSSWVEVD